MEYTAEYSNGPYPARLFKDGEFFDWGGGEFLLSRSATIRYLSWCEEMGFTFLGIEHLGLNHDGKWFNLLHLNEEYFNYENARRRIGRADDFIVCDDEVVEILYNISIDGWEDEELSA
jgi:hypothetical protein